MKLAFLQFPRDVYKVTSQCFLILPDIAPIMSSITYMITVIWVSPSSFSVYNKHFNVLSGTISPVFLLEQYSSS
jgi:hypothetical protein